MLGRFLEISVACEDPLAALGFYMELGFRELSTGDIWDHPYAVVSDGVLNIGLHGYEFDSPALTFVQANLDGWTEAYRIQNIELAFAKLSTDEFNELGFLDPAGQMVTVLESRTFSPPPFDDVSFSELGRFLGIAPPCVDQEASRRFWSKLGWNSDTDRLEGTGVTLTLSPHKALTCHHRGNPLALAEFAARRGLHNVFVADDEASATVKTAEGLVFHVAPA